MVLNRVFELMIFPIILWTIVVSYSYSFLVDNLYKYHWKLKIYENNTSCILCVTSFFYKVAFFFFLLIFFPQLEILCQLRSVEISASYRVSVLPIASLPYSFSLFIWS